MIDEPKLKSAISVRFLKDTPDIIKEFYGMQTNLRLTLETLAEEYIKANGMQDLAKVAPWRRNFDLDAVSAPAPKKQVQNSHYADFEDDDEETAAAALNSLKRVHSPTSVPKQDKNQLLSKYIDI